MTGLIILCLLSLAAVFNWRDKERLSAITVVMLVTIIGLAVYHFTPYAAVVQALGYYQEQSLYLLASISILYLVKGRLAFCLMVLCLAQLAINATYFTYAIMEIDLLPPFQGVMWVMFAIQMALLFSRRFTDVCVRRLLEFGGVRDFARGIVDIRRSDIRCSPGTYESKT